MPTLLGASGELGEEARLADPRLAHELERARRSSVELAENLFERFELVGAPDKRGLSARRRYDGVRHCASFG
jgi:hypothetical protein